MTAKTKSSNVYTLEVELLGSEPRIWRLFQVSGCKSLGHLHQTLQIVMGWEECHLHEFIIKKRHYLELHPEIDSFSDSEDEWCFMIGDVLRPRQHFTYIYDFGDGWQHKVVVKKVAQSDDLDALPLCLDGAMRCPPEDCGGIWGYYNFQEALADPSHPEHETYREWWDGEFDPKKFDVDTVNRRLARLRGHKPGSPIWA